MEIVDPTISGDVRVEYHEDQIILIFKLNKPFIGPGRLEARE